MNILLFLSSSMMPLTVFFIIAWGMAQKCPIYESFIKGAKDGFHTVLQIMPTLIGLMTAVGVLRASGFLDMVSKTLGSLLAFTGFPAEAVPYVIVRLFSSSAATSLVLDIFKTKGPDSHVGMLVSVLAGCTETVFYTMSVYFMSIKVTYHRKKNCCKNRFRSKPLKIFKPFLYNRFIRCEYRCKHITKEPYTCENDNSND